MDRETQSSFLLAHTKVQAHPFLPELQLHLATDSFGLWEDAEEAMARGELAPPFWASAWPGGLALARYILQHPELVLGRKVVDIATGSGVVAIAAAMSGALSVAAYDTDAMAVQVARLNAALNRVDIDVSQADVRNVSAQSGALVTAGDVFYDRTISAAMLAGLTALAETGAEVIIGDPYRQYLPEDRLQPLTVLDVDVEMFLESDPIKTTLVARLS